MNTYPIVWVENNSYRSDETLDGLVNSVCMFFIEKKGKRNPVYVLQSWPFHNEVFTKANNSKKLYSHPNRGAVKKYAEKMLAQFASNFVQPAKLDPATLTCFTTYHHIANKGRGMYVEDIDVLINMAEGFEAKYKETRPGGKDWENSSIDWESAIIDFYNQHHPASWNDIK